MNLFNLKNRKKGFTLVEILLVVGIVSIMSVGIYVKYKSMAMNNRVQLETQDLYAIGNKITSAYQSSSSLATLSNTTAIAGGLVPTELINTPNIVSRFGGTLTLSPVTVAAISGYEIKINSITTDSCGLIGASKFANQADEVWVNGVSMKTTGTSLTGANVAAITSACSSATYISFRNRMVYNNPPLSYAQTRPNQTSQYYIPSVANPITSASTSCSGGASWTGSFCSCPTNTEWDGAACTSNSTVLTNCAYGTGAVNGVATCQTLPTTTAQTTVFNGTAFVAQSNSFYTATAPASRAACTAANGYWDAITNICGGIFPSKVASTKNSVTTVYQGSRYIPQAMNGQIATEFPVLTAQGAAAECSNSGGNWDGKMCNVCPTPTTIGSVNTAIVNATTGTEQISNMTLTPTGNSKVVSGHSATSSWNTDRCVTPAGSTAPPYPQTVTW